jgi:hypothetical protein
MPNMRRQEGTGRLLHQLQNFVSEEGNDSLDLWLYLYSYFNFSYLKTGQIEIVHIGTILINYFLVILI